MNYLYLTKDIESFYIMVGILVHNGFDLDYDYMCSYLENHPGQFLILIRGD